MFCAYFGLPEIANDGYARMLMLPNARSAMVRPDGKGGSTGLLGVSGRHEILKTYKNLDKSAQIEVNYFGFFLITYYTGDVS